MAELTPRLAAIFAEYFPEEEDRRAACWMHPKAKKWLAHHWALKTIARKTGMEIADPVHVLERCEPGTVVFFQRATVTHGGRKYEAHAYGVATPENNKNGHHYPMAQKRGEDQVIVDLLEQIHGVALRKDLYGEDEADWDGPGKKAAGTRDRASVAKELDEVLDSTEAEWMAKIQDARSVDDLTDLFEEMRSAKISETLLALLSTHMDKRAKELNG
jgi:hypothetical protein